MDAGHQAAVTELLRCSESGRMKRKENMKRWTKGCVRQVTDCEVFPCMLATKSCVVFEISMTGNVLRFILITGDVNVF